jgi:hypothetical protein
MARNVHKIDFNRVRLPQEAISEDRGLSRCGTPYLVLADTEDAQFYRNDRTGIAYLFDDMTVYLEDKNGNRELAPGIEVTFPYQPDAVGFVIDWRQVVSGGALTQGCYRVVIEWDLEGNTGEFYYGSFNLRAYSVENAAKTVRLLVVLNDLVRKQGINYKDSGFATTIRFEGQFGYMQPNYDTENIIYTSRTREKVRNEAIRTYELRSNFLLSCQTRMIDEEYLLTANQIFVTDHNFNNHVDSYYDFPVILNEDESPTFEYNESIYAKIRASFKDKTAVYESKYDGNIQGSLNVILDLPTIVTTPAACPDTSIEVNGVAEGSVVAGSTVDVITNIVPSSSSLVGNNLTLTFTKELFWELNYNGTDDIILIPATVNNVGTLTSGTGSNVGTIDVSTDGVSYAALTFPFTPVNGTTYYFKRSTFTVTGSYTMTGTYA